MIIRNVTTLLPIELKINLFAPNPKACLPSYSSYKVRQGSKLIFTTPFRDGANRENQFAVSGINTDI